MPYRREEAILAGLPHTLQCLSSKGETLVLSTALTALF